MMAPLRSRPVVHLELHTGDLPQARALYTERCGWHPEWVDTQAGSYLSLAFGAGFGGGIVECSCSLRTPAPAGASAGGAHPPRRARLLGAQGRGALNTNPAGLDGALQRAHRAADERLPERSQQAVLRSLEDRELRPLVDGFVDAWERCDVDAVVAMLAADGTMMMPPQPTWYRGREAVAAFLSAVRCAANGGGA